MDQLHTKILEILTHGVDMTIATQREDGFPQATTVSYVNDGFSIYFGTGDVSQKTKNLARCDKVSLTIDLPYPDWDHITGISAAGICTRVTDDLEIGRVSTLMLAKFPQALKYAEMNQAGGMAVFRVALKVVSVLDYTKGFGHTDLVSFEA